MRNINGFIYLLTDNRNGKQYVGKHIGTETNYFSGGIIPNKVAKKYGKEIFTKIILEENIIDENILCIKEKYYIEKYNTFNNGYNLSEGGDGGGSWINKKTKEEKERISNIKREKNLGRKFSKETLEKMSLAKKGIPLSEEHKQKLSKAHKGKILTKETVDKMISYRTGRNLTESCREKISQSHCKNTYELTNKDGTTLIIKNLSMETNM